MHELAFCARFSRLSYITLSTLLHLIMPKTVWSNRWNQLLESLLQEHTELTSKELEKLIVGMPEHKDAGSPLPEGHRPPLGDLECRLGWKIYNERSKLTKAAKRKADRRPREETEEALYSPSSLSSPTRLPSPTRRLRGSVSNAAADELLERAKACKALCTKPSSVLEDKMRAIREKRLLSNSSNSKTLPEAPGVPSTPQRTEPAPTKPLESENSPQPQLASTTATHTSHAHPAGPAGLGASSPAPREPRSTTLTSQPAAPSTQDSINMAESSDFYEVSDEDFGGLRLPKPKRKWGEMATPASPEFLSRASSPPLPPAHVAASRARRGAVTHADPYPRQSLRSEDLDSLFEGDSIFHLLLVGAYAAPRAVTLCFRLPLYMTMGLSISADNSSLTMVLSLSPPIESSTNLLKGRDSENRIPLFLVAEPPPLSLSESKSGLAC